MASHRALLVLSFGGPEKNEDVIPFLENVTRGRGIPRERLAEVGEHYFAMDGKSPITEQNLHIIADLEAEIARRLSPLGLDLPVYFGNRNWHPYAEDTVERMARDGVTDALVLATSAWGGYSGHVQYLEDIARTEDHCRTIGLTPPKMIKLRPFHDHPLFLQAFAGLVDKTRAAMPDGQGEDARLLFSAHSIPLSADESSSADSTHRYSGQVITAAREIRERSSFSTENLPDAEVNDVELVWQSRSGPPHIPWLEPDICDYLTATIAGEGATSTSGEFTPGGDRRPILLCPVGFITDHMEVIWDLDTEAKDTATELGVPLVRVPTPGFTPEFPRMILDLIHEQWPDIPGEDL